MRDVAAEGEIVAAVCPVRCLGVETGWPKPLLQFNTSAAYYFQHEWDDPALHVKNTKFSYCRYPATSYY